MRIKFPGLVVVIVRNAGALAVRLAVSAVVWLLIFGVLGLALLVSGVGVLYGAGWALIAGGVACLAAAAFIKQGLTNG